MSVEDVLEKIDDEYAKYRTECFELPVFVVLDEIQRAALKSFLNTGYNLCLPGSEPVVGEPKKYLNCIVIPKEKCIIP